MLVARLDDGEYRLSAVSSRQKHGAVIMTE